MQMDLIYYFYTLMNTYRAGPTRFPRLERLQTKKSRRPTLYIHNETH